MNRSRIVVLVVVMLTLVAIGHHQLAQLSNKTLNTSFVPVAQAYQSPGPTPSPSPTPGNQGCTPGFWKNHTSAWQCFSPGATVSSVFTGVDPSLASSTLLQALSFQGGSTLAGAEEILLRAAVAALLNACPGSGVNYPLTDAQIVTLVNDAIASGDRATILGVASALDGFNNLGCPINGR